MIALTQPAGPSTPTSLKAGALRRILENDRECVALCLNSLRPLQGKKDAIPFSNILDGKSVRGYPSPYGESSALGLPLRALRAFVGASREGRGAARLPKVQKPLLEPTAQNGRKAREGRLNARTKEGAQSAKGSQYSVTPCAFSDVETD